MSCCVLGVHHINHLDNHGQKLGRDTFPCNHGATRGLAAPHGPRGSTQGRRLQPTLPIRGSTVPNSPLPVREFWRPQNPLARPRLAPPRRTRRALTGCREPLATPPGAGPPIPKGDVAARGRGAPAPSLPPPAPGAAARSTRGGLRLAARRRPMAGRHLRAAGRFRARCRRRFPAAAPADGARVPPRRRGCCRRGSPGAPRNSRNPRTPRRRPS